MKRPSLAGARPRTLAGLFLIVVGLPAIALVWLGAQLLLQDRSVAMQRESERRQADLQEAARALDKLLETAGQRLPEGAARYTISSSAISVEPAGSVLWLPNMPKLPAAPGAPFAEMERVEFQGGAARALVFYEQQTAKTNPVVQAGAWLRAARVHWRERRWTDALRAYDRLAAITSVAIDGLPADFVARRARCDVLREAGRTSELSREAEGLRADLLANRWALDRASWEHAATQITE